MPFLVLVSLSVPKKGHSFYKSLPSSENAFSYTGYCENDVVRLHKQDKCLFCG